MADNPVYYADFIRPDDSITKAIKQLEDLQDTYNDLAKTVKEDSIKIQASLDGVNSSTEDGRETTKKAATEVDKLAKARDKLTESQSNAGIELAKLRKIQTEQNKLTKLEIQLNKSKEGSYDKLSAQYSLNKIRLNKMSAEQRKATKTGQDLERETGEIYAEMKRLQEVTGKHTLNVGNYTDAQIAAANATNDSAKATGNYTEELGDAVAEQEVMGTSISKLMALFTTTTGLIAAGVGVIAGLGKAYVSSARGANDLARASDRLDSILSQLGNSIADLGGDTGFLDDLLAGLQMQLFGLQSAVISTIQVASKETLRELEIVEIEQEAQKKKQLDRAEVLRQIRDEERNSIEERKAANDELGEIINKREKETIEFQNKRLAQYAVLLSLDEDNLELQKAIAQVQFEIADAEEEAQGYRSEQKMNDLALAREVNENELLLAQKRIEGELIIYEEGSRSRFNLEKELVEITKQLQVRAAGENEQLKNIAIQEAFNARRQLEKDFAFFQTEQRNKANEESVKNAEKVYNAEVDYQNQLYDLRLSEVDLMQTTEDEKTRLRLQAEKDRLEAILKINRTLMNQLSDEEIQTVKNTIQAIDGEMKAVGKNDVDLYSVLGLDLDDDKKEAIATSTAFAIDNVMMFLQAKIDAADAAVEASEMEVDSAQSRLDAEIEARNNGYANSVSSAQKELALAKKTQDKALKEQEKAQKAEAAIQTLQQIGSLVTASAKIWGQLGFPWAIPAIAVMFGSFAFAKVKASQSAKQQYGDGGLEILNGGSHASGNDIPIGTTKDGKRRTAEGGEALAIINKSKTRKYRNMLPGIIKSLNKGEFEKKFGNSYGTDGMNVMVSGGSDMKTLEKDVGQIRKQGERRYYTDGKGRVVEVYKNLKRVYNAN